MDNREYFEQKKEAFYKKIGDWFEKHFMEDKENV